jgi:hypothetical protein
VFLCHIVSIQVDKQGLDISKLTRQIMYLPPIDPKLRLMKSSMKRSGFGFQTWKFQKPPKIQLHFRATKKDRCLPFHFHVLNLFKSWSNLGFDQDSNGHKNSDKKSKE